MFFHLGFGVFRNNFCFLNLWAQVPLSKRLPEGRRHGGGRHLSRCLCKVFRRSVRDDGHRHRVGGLPMAEPPGTSLSSATQSADGRECGADGATGFKNPAQGGRQGEEQAATAPSTEDEKALQGKDERHGEEGRVKEDHRSEKKERPRKRKRIDPTTKRKVDGETVGDRKKKGDQGRLTKDV